MTSLHEEPKELWLFWCGQEIGWLVSEDDAPGGCTYLVAFDEHTAKIASQYQKDLYGVDNTPILVKWSPSVNQQSGIK